MNVFLAFAIFSAPTFGTLCVPFGNIVNGTTCSPWIALEDSVTVQALPAASTDDSLPLTLNYLPYSDPQYFYLNTGEDTSFLCVWPNTVSYVYQIQGDMLRSDLLLADSTIISKVSAWIESELNQGDKYEYDWYGGIIGLATVTGELVVKFDESSCVEVASFFLCAKAGSGPNEVFIGLIQVKQDRERMVDFHVLNSVNATYSMTTQVKIGIAPLPPGSSFDWEMLPEGGSYRVVANITSEDSTTQVVVASGI